MSENNDFALDYLKKHPPKLKQSAESSLVPSSEIVLVYEGIAPESIDAVKLWLTKYAHPANDALHETKYVDGLTAQNLQRDGIWRIARISTGRDINLQNQYFLEISYRLGYAQDANYDEALVVAGTFALTNSSAVSGVSGTTSDNPMLSYTLRFPNIAPDRIEVVRATLQSAGTVADKTVQTTIGTPLALSGTWNVNKIEDKQEDDGSHSVYMTIAQSLYNLQGYTNKGTPKETTDYHLSNVPLDIAQQIASDFGAAGVRRTVSFSYRDGDKLCDMILRERLAPATEFSDVAMSTNCRFVVTANYFFSVADPTSAAYDIESTVSVPGTTYDKKVSENGDGTYDVVIIKTVRQEQELTYTSENDASGVTVTALKLGTTDAIVALQQETGKIKRRAITLNEDCSKDIRDETETPTDQEGETHEVSPSGTTDEVSHTENAVPLSAPAQETGKIKTNISDPTKAGNWKTRQIVQTPSDQVGSTSEVSAAKTETTVTHTEGPELDTPTQETGKIKRRISDPTKAGNFSTRDIEIVPEDQESKHQSDSAAAESVTYLHTENSAQVTGAAAAGTRRIIRNVPTEAGNFRTEDEVITPKDQEATDVSDDTYFSREVAKHTENPAPLTGAAATGTRRKITNIPTDVGNYQTADEVETEKQIDQAETQKTIEAEFSDERLVKRGQLAATALPTTYTVGDAIQVIENKLSEYGRYASDIRTLTPSDPFVSGWQEIADIDGTWYLRFFANVDPADVGDSGANDPLDGMDATTNNTYRPTRNRWGLLDGYCIRAPKDENTGTLGVATFEIEYDTTRYQFAVVSGQRKYRTVSWHIGIKQTTSATAAKNFVDGKENSKIAALSGGRVFKASYAQMNVGIPAGWELDE